MWWSSWVQLLIARSSLSVGMGHKIFEKPRKRLEKQLDENDNCKPRISQVKLKLERVPHIELQVWTLQICTLLKKFSVNTIETITEAEIDMVMMFKDLQLSVGSTGAVP